MVGETGASDAVTDPKEGGLKKIGDLPEVSWAGTNDSLGNGSITQMYKDQAKVAEGVAAATQHLESPASEGSEAPLGKGNIQEMYKDQEAMGAGAEALAALLADVPSMPFSTKAPDGSVTYPFLDSLGSLTLVNGARSEAMMLGGMFQGVADAGGQGTGTVDKTMKLHAPSTSFEDQFPGDKGDVSEEAKMRELTLLANTELVKTVTDYKTGKLGELGEGEVGWTDPQAREMRIMSMLQGLANRDVVGDGPFAKMVGGVASAAQKVREGTRAVANKIGGLKDLAGKSGGGSGGEPPTTSPGGTPPAAL